MPAQPTVVAVLVIGGLAVFLVGAGLASSLNAWSADGAEHLAAVARGPEVAWGVGNYLLAVGVVLTAAGLVVLTAVVNTPAAWAGAGLWLVAAAVGAVGFVLQGDGALAAADLLTSEGRIPDGFWPLHRVQEALLHFYGATGLLASALIGVGVLRTTWLPGSIGWAALIAGSLGAAAIAVGVELIPAVTQLVAAVFGVAIVVPPRGAAVSVAGEAS